ncbi:hypothetical protein H5P28_01185 [Ruficoccus amylovorans]|uniref:Uncharacterized protein n=1 Tax=Ruficoccus amylovorans TaxID=1804625 RepID=A0A842H8K9_9BACT|nr:hypothetical protein [Ruficoccus amylovorans]MBC2592863.1 hypothetical protein [Ruficoccus amylovorans]
MFIDRPVEEKELPLPWVDYGFGPWVTFRERQDSVAYLCSCARSAAKFWLARELANGQRLLAPGNKNLLSHFAINPAGQAMAIEELEGSGFFRNGICHLCTGHVPTLHTGGNRLADTRYYPYLDQVGYELGLVSEYDPEKFTSKRDLRVYERLNQRLGLKGDMRREDLLWLCLRGAFPNVEILRNVRPPELEGLELDFWLPAQWVGIEYQGQQHAKPVDFFGGESGYNALVERDKRKRELCAKHGIYLEEFNHDDMLTEANVKERLLRYWHDPKGISPPRGAYWILGEAYRPSGVDWEKLTRKQRMDVKRELWLMQEMSRRCWPKGKKYRTAALDVAKKASVLWGEIRGISPTSIQNKFRFWRKRDYGGDWRHAIRYESLIQDKMCALRELGISLSQTKAYFSIYPGGLTAWAKAHSIDQAEARKLTHVRARIDSEVAQAFKSSLECKTNELRVEVRRLERELKALKSDYRRVRGGITS